MPQPRYPQVRVQIRSAHPLALIGAVRFGLRRAGIDRDEIERFSAEAFASTEDGGLFQTCRAWVDVERRRDPRLPPSGDGAGSAA